MPRAPRPEIWFLAALALALPGRAPAQEAGASAAGLLVLEAPSSVESMAYGNAPYLYSTSPTLLFDAPALLQRSEGVAVSLQRYGGEGTLASAAGAGTFQDGGFAIGLQYFRYEAGPTFPVARDVESVALDDAASGVTQLVASAGYARSIFGLRAGAALKLAEQSVDASSDATVAVDVGLAKEVGSVLLTVMGRNLGGDLRLETPSSGGGATETEFDMPSEVAAAASIDDFQLGPLDMFVTSRVARRRDGEIVPAGGVEVSYWPVAGYTFRLRGGVQRVVDDARSPFTLGAAFTGDDITVEYAWQPFDGEGSGHRFGLRWR